MNVRLTVRHIHHVVYDWGVENRKLPPIDNPEKELKHYGKEIKDFDKRERRAFEDALEDLERFFEVSLTHNEE